MTGPPRDLVGVAQPDVDAIALAVAACPLVAGLHSGVYGEVATYLPGRRVQGVRVTAVGVEIHVVGRYPATMTQIAAQVRDATATVTNVRPIDVTIEDVVQLGEPVPDAAASGGPIRHEPSTTGPRAGAPVFPPVTAPDVVDGAPSVSSPAVAGSHHLERRL